MDTLFIRLRETKPGVWHEGVKKNGLYVLKNAEAAKIDKTQIMGAAGIG